MLIGSSQVDITPQVGAELSGFAARKQPSVGIVDRLFAKAIYLVDRNQKVLWIHCDLLELDREIVVNFRRWVHQNLGLNENQVTISATHTHSGPCTVRLREAGTYDPAYVAVLQSKLQQVARRAMADTEECHIVAVEGRIGLAHDRRKTSSSHTDPRVASVAFRRSDDSYVAVLVNYPIHPVALGATNRYVSADIPGRVAHCVAQQLPGKPLVMVTNGASGNLNPPAENVPYDQIARWGEEIAGGVSPLLMKAAPLTAARLSVASRIIPLPLDALSAEGIDAASELALQYPKPLAEWGETYRRAVRAWRQTMTAAVQKGDACNYSDAELFAVSLGEVVFISLNGEVFSHFADWLRDASALRVYVVGYANGGLGYLPTLAAYAEGGYEVEVAHIFQGHFRVKPGGLELLAREAIKLIKETTGTQDPGVSKKEKSRMPKSSETKRELGYAP
jgi:neutral ceramidase